MRCLRACLALGVLAVVTLSLSACTPANVKRLQQSPPDDLPVSAQVQQVPFFAQTELFCGPSTLAMILQHYQIETPHQVLVEQVYTPGREGSLQVEIVAALRRNGLIPYQLPPTLEALLTQIAAGYPVIVLQNLGLPVDPKWHYAVVIGYDLDKSEMVLHSGTIAEYRMPISTFAHTWKRAKQWALVPLPGGKLPAFDKAETVFIAISDYEQTVGGDDVAMSSYKAAQQRWPDSALFALATANVLHNKGAYSEATTVLLTGIEQSSDNVAALYNNLAYALIEQACYSSAIQAVTCALSLGDRHPVYKASWQDIQQLAGQRENAPNCPVLDCKQ